MSTTDDIMALADACFEAETAFFQYNSRGELRKAVEHLIAERDALKAAHEAIATLDHTRPLLDARTISRAALRGQP